SFTPLPGYFSPFPHGTHALSVTRRYSGLASGPARFTAPSTEALLLGIPPESPTRFRLRESHPLRWRIPTPSANEPELPVRMAVPTRWSHNPAHATAASSYHAHGLAIIRFRSPLLTESLVFSLPAGTEMFHFPAFPPTALYIQTAVTGHHSGRVTPFGHPRITAR